ncbi:hypothetical protein A0H81_09478 [Grifola frondosa]|uniref:Uncharacterized protein n=1 Tax=Grifola frondosa TaxID=5627 RepID=A0A1C7M707_GRIFR|nr:hypothetical protein A0H81_09478 [Grifola frondosa]
MSIDDTRTRFIFPKPVDIRPLAGQVIVQTLPDATSCATSATDDRQVRDTLDQKDNGCLLTNVHRHTDEKVRLIGIQRGDIVNKKDIELLLYIKLGISPVIDSLDHMSNFFWLDSSLHRAFDQYGLFAITVSKNTGLQLKKLLEDEFDDRQRIADEGGDAQPRLFYGFMSNIYNLEFVKKPELQVVALLPISSFPTGFP